MNGGTPPQMLQQQNTGNPPSGEAPTGEQTQNNSDTTNTTSNS